jgi:acetolactate synthase-1/2/3 large subunit
LVQLGLQTAAEWPADQEPHQSFGKPQNRLKLSQRSFPLKAAEAVMSTAREQGLEHFFGIPGGGSPLELMDAGRKAGVQFVNVSHESSAAIAAAYYGVLKKTAGLAMSIRGVGAANLAGGVANVFFERLPLVGICEAPPVSNTPTESVQQCDQPRLFEGVCGYQSTLTTGDAPEMIRRAFAQAVDGRPIPSILHLPAGLGELNDNQPPSEKTATQYRPIDESGLNGVREFLKSHSRIVILAGADVIRCGAIRELLEFAEAIEATVLVTMEARGVFPESHPRWAGVFLGLFNPNVIEGRVFQQADAAVFVGVDAMMTHAPWKLELPSCELAARREYSTMSSPVVRANGDLKSMLRRLTAGPKAGFSETEIKQLRSGILPYFKRPSKARFTAQDVIEITRELLPAEGLLLSETGAYICFLEHLWPVERPGTYLGTSGGRSMGLTVPAALGARLADRERPMVGMGADGSLLMRLGELETIARSGVALPLVIINDQALGTMKARQRARGFVDYGLDLHSVDFAAIARASGLQGVIVDTPEAFRRELAQAMKSDRTTLIDARVDPQAYQDSFGPTIGDLSQLPRAGSL